MHDVLASDKQAKQFTQLKHGQILQFELSADGKLKQLHSKVSDLEAISLSKTDKGYAFNREITKPNVRTAYAHGLINSSLSQTAQRAGLSHSMTMDMASVFGYDIDFAQDIRQGDEFDVIYEQKVVNGKSRRRWQYPVRPLHQPWQNLHRCPLYQQTRQHQLLHR